MAKLAKMKPTASTVLSRWTAICLMALLGGCTSLGHEGRAHPQIEHKLDARPQAVALTGSGELSIALELSLVSQGITVHASPIKISSDPSSGAPKSEVVARYQITATSVDQDMCVPEGSRQMHFHISIVDLVENKRVFAMSGDYGCKDTIVKRFNQWFFNDSTK